MVGKLLAFELSYHLQKRSFGLGFLAFGLLGLFFSTTQGRVDSEILINAPSVLVKQIGLLSLGTVFVAAFLANAAFLRDDHYRVTQLVWATPVGRSALFWSRFVGVFLVASLIFLAAPIGMLIDVLLAEGGPRKTGPVEISHYAWIVGVLSLPTIVFSTAVMTAIALYSRHRVAAYTAAIALYLGYFAAAFLVGSPVMAGATPASPDIVAWAAVLDPFGISAYYEQAKGWSILERNSLLFDLNQIMLKNRGLWLLVALLTLAAALRGFGPNLGEQRAPAKTQGGGPEGREFSYKPTRPTLGRVWARSATLALTKLEIRFLYRSWTFAAIFVLWCVAITPEMFAVLHQSDYSNPRYPTTQALLERFQFDMLPFFGTVFLIFLAGESVWRERSDRINQLLGATPVRPVQLFVSRFIALSCLPLILITSSVFLVIAVQLSHGWYKFQPDLLGGLYLYSGLPLIAAVLIALFCQVIAAGRYSGMALSAVLMFGVAGTLGINLGLEHPMFRIATVPDLTSAGMTGFGHGNLIFISYMVFWSSLGALLSLATVRYWPKGVATGLASVRLSGSSPSRLGLVIGSMALVLAFVSGGWIFYQTNIVSGWQSSSDREASLAEFERRFGHFAERPMPSLAAVSTKLDLFPSWHRAEMQGEYRLVNRSDKAIEEVLVVLGRKAFIREMRVENAVLTEFDEDHRAWVFKLDVPLLPGQSTSLAFGLSWKQTGFADLSRSFQLVENGSLIRGPASLPYVGFPEALRIRDSVRRNKHGLEPLPAMPALEQAVAVEARPFAGNYDKVQFETVISTIDGETALAPGSLVRKWSEGGRNYFHYRSNAPVTNMPVYASARYQCVQDHHRAIQLEVCFTEDRAENVPAIMAAMKDAVGYAELQFGHYPGDILRAVQVSGLTGISGFAAPNTLLLGEDTAFAYDRNASSVLIDQIYRVIAHETAHQWWGHHLVPARSDKFQGSMVLVETLARYSELMILEKKYGPAETRKWLDYELGRYFRGRGRDAQPEVPLYKVTGQEYLMYSKGAAAMYALKTALGEKAVNHALAALVTKYAVADSPATSLDLLAEIYRVSDPAERAFIDSWFKEIVHTDLSFGAVGVFEEADGRFRIELSITASNERLDGMGNSTVTPFQGPLAVHFLDQEGSVMHEMEVSGAEAEQGISMLFDTLPTSIVLDPNYRYLDPQRENNTAAVAALQ